MLDSDEEKIKFTQKIFKRLILFIIVSVVLYELYYFVFVMFAMGSYGTHMMNQSRSLPQYKEYTINEHNDSRIAYYAKEFRLSEKENIFSIKVKDACKAKVKQDLVLNCIGYFSQEYDKKWNEEIQLLKNSQSYSPMDVMSQRNSEEWEFYEYCHFNELSDVEEKIANSLDKNISKSSCEKLESAEEMFYRVLPLYIALQETKLKDYIQKKKVASVTGKYNQRFYQKEIIKIHKLMQIFNKGFSLSNHNMLEDNTTAKVKNISSFTAYKKDKERGVSPLFAAIQNGLYEEVSDLINKGENVDAKNKFSSPPLIFAIEHKDARIVKILLSHGAKSDVMDGKDIYSALSKASSKNSISTVKLLIKYGANVNYQYKENETALTVAAKGCENFELVKLLLDNGADAMLMDRFGYSTLMGLRRYCSDDISYVKMKKLIKQKGEE